MIAPPLLLSVLRRTAALIALMLSLVTVVMPAAAQQSLKIAMILPGPISDNDWNAGGYNGLQAASKALGVEVAYSENVTDADAERVMRDYASRGYGLIFAHSFSYGDAVLNVAADFPGTTFMAGTAQSVAPNVGTYDNPDYQGAYLSGMLSAGASKSGIIGWVGGNPAPNMLANFHAWKLGAEAVNPKVKVLITFIGSWFDPPKAKEAAIAQVEQGADVLSAQAVGVIDAAKEKKVLAIGAVSDQNHLGPDAVLTSVLWDLGPLVTDTANAVMNKTWTSKAWTYGVAKGSIKLADFHGLGNRVPADVQAKVNATFDAIKAGTFEVPHDTSMVK
ncbi:BMP family ABC transporter substrate-binding protein [Agrobacterium vitis]|uniref:BMP family ABC transporter substrate-binding protein n=1 Tax=Agrobacterium vitis TaxID=373 RepID=A0A368NMG0_AGRVI|nr:BMP family protein [Agrobacterium vitis]KAA3506292.1 BMP family ABC transporter substrate-binding protein [Agrobacterium vitis]KAA3520708.1 BMP family ABC transporter substrate-binding protein [Agrobacterium vitis]MCF1480261.1 BMP family ABC transporter substrate-binding protein [Agrobacterium vitis]MUZ99620.1 BMP family ABC transporter substrate-binding protein [Agrobacterium vitis]MVA32392.1 BMP family ABC transporter substrate-binding protein [Agrobacterium vitis]